MVITQMSGGLGNQMFQYALARKLAGRDGGTVAVDSYQLKINRSPPRRLVLDEFAVRWQPAGWFEIGRHSPRELLKRWLHGITSRHKWLAGRLERIGLGSPCRYRFYDYRKDSAKPPLKIGGVVSERHFHFDPEVLELSGNLLLMGYWQTEKYFAEIAPQLRAEFQVKTAQQGRDLAVAAQMQAVQSVSLHVRRGDKAVAKDFNASSVEFCFRAVAWFRERFSSPVFFVFTDDWAWVREHLPAGPDIVHVDHNDEAHDYEDLRLMSQCRHHIIAPSSFSWWAAWLNPNPDKTVLSPPHQRWLNFPNCDTRDVIPGSWIQLDDR